MPHIANHPPGRFCWIELGTTNQTAAKSFYGSLFGWAANDQPIGPDAVYTRFQLEGRDAAAAYTLEPELRSQGVPAHWMIYIAASSADDAATRTTQLGGKVLKAPFDVFNAGRMAVLEDPTGAQFCVWQANKNSGIGIAGPDGTLCWADLSTPDQDRASKFYAGLFGWKMTFGEKDPTGYLHIMNGEEFIGGIPPAWHRNPNAPPQWLAYFVVSDCDSKAAQAAQLGAKLLAPPMTIENVGRMSVVADPQGAVFAIFQALPRG